MLNTDQPADADRIALTNMFKAIAEYGRKARQRRQAESQEAEQTELEKPNQDSQGQPCAIDQRDGLSDIDSS